MIIKDNSNAFRVLRVKTSCLFGPFSEQNGKMQAIQLIEKLAKPGRTEPRYSRIEMLSRLFQHADLIHGKLQSFLIKREQPVEPFEQITLVRFRHQNMLWKISI